MIFLEMQFWLSFWEDFVSNQLQGPKNLTLSWAEVFERNTDSTSDEFFDEETLGMIVVKIQKCCHCIFIGRR